MTKLVRTRHPHRSGKTPRARHSARHARTSHARPCPRASLAVRSAERRRWSPDLTGPGSASLVLYGVGGIGKSTLATQIAARLTRLQPDRVVATISGEVSPATFAAAPAGADLIVLDDFDDNLSPEQGGWSVADPALASLLAAWTGKLLVTCRLPFAMPGAPPRRLSFRRLGPLTRSGAAELAASLPALGLLDDAERDQAWRLTAGHPLALEYLDALLADGEPYPGVAARISAAVQASTGQPVPRIEPAELLPPAEEMVTRAVGDQMFGELFGRLSAGAKALLVRASVFRLPVRPGVLGGRPRQIAECEAARLLTVGPDDELSVRRWTADQLHRRLAGAARAAELADAHRRAAGYWRSTETGERAELEAGHHLRQASALDRQPQARRTARPGRRLRVLGTAAAAALAAFLATETPHVLTAQHVAAPGAQATSQAPVLAPVLTGAAAARDQAASWVARHVDGGATFGCDPAMCAALARAGIPAGNLLRLGPGAAGAGDPLGSDVVLATAPLRAMFGGRLPAEYAPIVLVSFGAGAARIDVRAVAPDGAAAYRLALAADLQARRMAGPELLRDSRLRFSPSARAELVAGQPDARLLLTLAVLAADGPVRVLDFGGPWPGASPGLPLRIARLVVATGAVRNVLAFLSAQHPPYLAEHASVDTWPAGRSLVTVEFAAPSPLGLLGAANSKIKFHLSRTALSVTSWEGSAATLPQPGG